MDARMRQRQRTKFSRRVYFVFVLFLAIALLQWALISIMPASRNLSTSFMICCPITFCLAAMLFCLFAFIRFMRSQTILKWVMAAAIVELYVVSMFVLAIASWVPDLTVFFIICMVAVVAALVIGCNLSYTMDMTKAIAPIFITSFIMAAASMYALMLHFFVMQRRPPYAFAVFEIIISLMMLMIVMLHAQTIKGNRFIQMNTDDYLLAALLLFHEFLAIYALTFYWQITYAFFTPTDFFWKSSIPVDIWGSDQYQNNEDMSLRIEISPLSEASSDYDDDDIN